MQGFAMTTPRTPTFLFLGQVRPAPRGGHQNNVGFAKQFGHVAVNVTIGVFSLPDKMCQCFITVSFETLSIYVHTRSLHVACEMVDRAQKRNK